MPGCKFYVHMLVITFLLTGMSSTSLGNPPQNPPLVNEVLDLGDGLSMDLWKLVPNSLPTKKTMGLILTFHGHGGAGKALLNWPSRHWLRHHGLEDQYVVIGLKASRKGYIDNMGDWEEADFEPVFKTYEWAMKKYPIDSRRVHLIGFSRGGFMVTRFIWKNLKYFATVTAVAGAYSPGWTKESLPGRDFAKLKPGQRMEYKAVFEDFRKIISKNSLKSYISIQARKKVKVADMLPEFYHIHGVNDALIDVNLTRCYTRDLGKTGLRYIYRERDDGNHGNIFGWDEKSNNRYFEDNFAWIHATRNKILPLSKTDQKTLAIIRERIGTLESNKALPLIGEAARIGGSEAGKALIKALDSKHADVRAASIKSAYTTSYGPDFTAKLGEFIRDKDPAIDQNLRFNACHVLGTYAKWRQRDAQSILINAVLDTSLSQYIRFQLITAISKTYEFLVPGNKYDDKIIIKTLIQLLDDHDEGVRAYSHMILVKGTNGVSKFGYNASDSKIDRQTAVKRWSDWALKATAPLLSEDFIRK